MFPIILNSLEDDDEDLLSEANHSTFDEQSPLFQDNLRCTVGQRIGRRFSFSTAARNSQINQINSQIPSQTLQPGERIIEIKSESEDDADESNANLIQHLASSSTANLNERSNLLANDQYRFQRFRPIREYDLGDSDPHSEARIQRNYQVLKSKRRFTFPICFFVGLYIAFLVGSSLIFTMFEQRIVKTDEFFELQRQLTLSLSEEQLAMVESLVRQSVHLQRGGLDALEVLYDNKLVILDELASSPGYDRRTVRTDGGPSLSDPAGNSSVQLSAIQQPLSTISFSNAAGNWQTASRLRSRKTYNWDFQQALFFVVSIATTIGYGNLSPESDNGKIFTIVFAMLAIPYTTLLLAVIVGKFCNGPLRRFKLRLLTRFQEKTDETLRYIRVLCLILATVFLLVVIMGLPAIGFSRMEKNWSYLDGFYFIFISITTTGLGDYVPEFFATLHHWLYETVTILFLYLGIIVIMLWMTLIKSVFRKSPSVKLEYDQDENDRHEDLLEEQVLINYHYRQKNYVNYGSFYGYDEITVRLPRPP